MPYIRVFVCTYVTLQLERVRMINASQDVGAWSEDANNRFGVEHPGSESYLTLNGLNVADDAVLGDYVIWGAANVGTKWTITARSGGELLWIEGGVFSEFQYETDTFTATVSTYAEGDCTINAYGESCLHGPPGKVQANTPPTAEMSLQKKMKKKVGDSHKFSFWRFVCIYMTSF